MIEEGLAKLVQGDPTVKAPAGLINLEAITVQYESRSRKTQLSIMPRNIAALKKFVEHYFVFTSLG